ncbi:multiple epidermal growth factor-like domains protein 9 [Latimeria chalumnae]|uniref:Multiple EGF like domains 9 n=1 Tax=Latimeria chalumnae TaxID=7897 RepID=H3B5V6_LATCH|nr:PREDICTED: multiple epidermal growth factor-like domains protein 9 [Latimeria chalumnae]|eukprot:XP_005994408.1 PREDICTED: multiple epidermal growth factor-like domains protein 9 [Latimeria chalumnae]
MPLRLSPRVWLLLVLLALGFRERTAGAQEDPTITPSPPQEAAEESPSDTKHVSEEIAGTEPAAAAASSTVPAASGSKEPAASPANVTTAAASSAGTPALPTPTAVPSPAPEERSTAGLAGAPTAWFSSTPSALIVASPSAAGNETGNNTESAWEPRGAEHDCNCSSIGSGIGNESQCLPSGQCKCLPGYISLQCRECDEEYFQNGSSGHCIPCNCNTTGTVSPQCDSSGKCKCKAGVAGPLCDQCLSGYYGFGDSGCVLCQCNNHSSTCDSVSGTCQDCQNGTIGLRCETCQSDYYRKQNASLSNACTRCPCSPVMSTGTCYLVEDKPICNKCLPGYTGPNCENCDNGFFNNDSICLKCECNDNVNLSNTSKICDPKTGQCLNCTNNTTGWNCESCLEGHVRKPDEKTCTKAEIFTTVAPTTDDPTRVMTPGTDMTSLHATTAPNVTLLATSTQAVLTTLMNSSENTTSAVAEVSWTQFNIIILAVIIVVVVVLMGFVGGVYMYREYQNRKLNAPFWTIELKEDNISFSSYHDSIPNADVSGLLEDDGNEVIPNGQLSLSAPINNYSKA